MAPQEELQTGSAKPPEFEKVYREKYWSEIGIEERIERMRSEVKRMKRVLQKADDALRQLEQAFLTHNHNPQDGGQPSCPARYSLKSKTDTWEETRIGGIVPGKDDVYF